MKKINIEILNKPTCYDIIIDKNLLNDVKNLFPDKSKYSLYVIIFDSNIDSNTIDKIKALFNDALYISIDLTNNKKSFEQFLHIQKKLIRYNVDRNSLILSIGGGSTGDLVAFVASTYNRGVNYVQIPTTLLAMIDSSIGGKTGLDSEDGKNLIGTFYHPQLVVIDTNFLLTLSKEEITSGLFEAIKYGVAFDLELFLFIKENKDDLYSINILTDIIEWCCQIKTDIIIKDEKDNSIRNKLNFGHTVGHAIESYFKYKNILHGEAVYYGMIAASYLSNKKGYLSDNDFNKINNFITKIPKYNIENINVYQLLEYIKYDKKILRNKKQFILLNKIGNAIITNHITSEDIKESINFLLD